MTRPEEIYASSNQAEPNKDKIAAELENTSPIAPETKAGGITTESDKKIDTSLPNSDTRIDSLHPKGPSMTRSEKLILKRKLPSSDTDLQLRRSQRVAKKVKI